MGLDTSLVELRTAWEAIPAETRAGAARAFGEGLAALAAGLHILGPHLTPLQAPGVAAVMRAFQDVALWQRPFDDVAIQIETVFPTVVVLLKALAASVSLAPAPPAALAPLPGVAS